MKAAIYARYSTDLQSERSIEDQVALCRAHAGRQGLTVSATYSDRARSGASVFGRDGLQRMMDDARDRRFQVLVVEALDRLSRDQEDLAGIFKRLRFLGVEIRAVHDGTADEIQIGVRGLVGALYLADLAHKVRRGMAGVVRDGRYAGGRPYGYRTVAGRPGILEVYEPEAEIVRRIIREYMAGESPRAIAGRLNRDGTPPPRARAWNASTINGSAERGTGILHNQIYAGRQVWNRLRMVKDPDTGRRISRLNPADQHQTVDVPHLALVTADEWEALQARVASRSGVPVAQIRRPRNLLSGLLRCGACGAGMAAHGRDKTGRSRISCSRKTESGACNHRRVYYLDAVETVVLDGLRDSLRDPVLISEYVAAYREERRRLAGSRASERAARERRLRAVRQELERMVDAIAQGAGVATIRERLAALEQERAEIEEQLAAPPLENDVIALHPGAVGRYLAQVESLSETLRQGIRSGDGEAAGALRELVESVAVIPTPPRTPVVVEVRGRLAALLSEQRLPPSGRYSGVPVVAEARSGRSPTIAREAFVLRLEGVPNPGKPLMRRKKSA